MNVDLYYFIFLDMFGWSESDVTYVKQNEREKKYKTEILPETREILKKWLWADYMLYNHFLNKMKKMIKKFGQSEMKQRSDSLKEINQNLEVKIL